MTASNSSRKRLHSPEKDVDDCLPISKRIHRLQIEPEGTSSTEEEYKHLMRSDSCAEQGSPEEVPASPWQHLPTHQSNQTPVGSGDLHPLSSHNGTSNISSNTSHYQTMTNLMASHNTVGNLRQLPMLNGEIDMVRYSPELVEEENPHYFNINRLLFQANSSRIVRSRSSLTMHDHQSM